MKDMKNIVDIVQGIVTIGAVLVGGIWTYLVFVRKRLRYPRAELTVTVHSTLIPPEYRLVHVGLRVSNSGDVLLAPEYAEVRLRHVKPVPAEIECRFKPGLDPVEPGETALPWPLIVGREWKWQPKEIEIEPGESDLLDSDFVIKDTVEVVQIYAFLKNPAKRREPRGWMTILMHTFSPISGVQSMAGNEKERTDPNEKQQRQQEQQKPQQQQQTHQQQQQTQQSSGTDQRDQEG